MRPRRALALTLGIVLVSLGMVLPAGATFPGRNGKIAFVNEPAAGGTPEIFVMSPRGRAHNLTNNRAVDLQPDWSPDGDRIVFVSFRDGNEEVYVMNADGSHSTRLTNDPASDEGPNWSPDGEHILFVSDRTGSQQLYVMDAVDPGRDGNGDNLTQVGDLEGQVFASAWSPDGERIAFTNDPNGPCAVFTMAVDGSDIRQLTPDGLGAGEPDLSPDGTRIVFESNACILAISDLFVMQSDGTNIRQITSDFGNSITPSWSPDGELILFENYADLTFPPSDLYVTRPDGAGRRNLTKTPDFYEFDADWQRILDDR